MQYLPDGNPISSVSQTQIISYYQPGRQVANQKGSAALKCGTVWRIFQKNYHCKEQIQQNKKNNNKKNSLSHFGSHDSKHRFCFIYMLHCCRWLYSNRTSLLCCHQTSVATYLGHFDTWHSKLMSNSKPTCLANTAWS